MWWLGRKPASQGLEAAVICHPKGNQQLSVAGSSDGFLVFPHRCYRVWTQATESTAHLGSVVIIRTPGADRTLAGKGSRELPSTRMEVWFFPCAARGGIRSSVAGPICIPSTLLVGRRGISRCQLTSGHLMVSFGFILSPLGLSFDAFTELANTGCVVPAFSHNGQF